MRSIEIRSGTGVPDAGGVEDRQALHNFGGSVGDVAGNADDLGISGYKRGDERGCDGESR